MFMKIALFSTLGIVTSSFIAYCFYFDYHRVRAKDYKKKLRAKRLKQEAERQTTQQQVVLDLSSPAAREALLKAEYEKGMSLLMEENNHEAVTHFMNVVQLSPDPLKMINIFRQMLPQELFIDMMQQFQQLSAQMSASANTPSNGGETIALD
ncbi:Mitochondrial import receptor subunit TOM20-like [Oopsacas minuta]|uniref:Mitochondrial import receptor subunit TOM20-like n=1 Tax=Oopsacas minuta TaxID=111878 RepID=A0AAV7JMA9_9METZ|nr:Mitochondrial import receptor subunit TOM20-like [Oopsacas minuta]